jgi:hypothetical protein
MNKCKKCSKEFQPSKGLINYCSMSCRNSRSRPESVRRKISEGVKKSGYLQSEEWLQNLTAANRREDVIQKKKETWVSKRDYENAHIGSLKKYYLETVDGCERCGLNEWNEQPLVLEVHHLDSNTNNNTFDNFQALCPNCHSQTKGWRNKNN